MPTNDLLEAYSMVRRELALLKAAALKESDLGSMQMVILYLLASCDRTMGELAEFAMVDKASMTRAVASLEKSGLVKRLPHESDRRIIVIQLTSKGRTKAQVAVGIREDIGKRFNATLASDERKELTKLLNKVVTGLQEKRS